VKLRIDRIQTFSYTYPTGGHFKFFEQPRGRAAGRPTVIVKITAENGTVGWGQCVPSPRWSYETLETCLTTIETYLAPELIGRDPFDANELQAAMNRVIAPSFSTGQPIAKAGVDLALFDLTGRMLGQAAAERWGRRGRDRISLSWTINVTSLDEVPEQVEAARQRGYRSFNVKVANQIGSLSPPAEKVGVRRQAVDGGTGVPPVKTGETPVPRFLTPDLSPPAGARGDVDLAFDLELCRLVRQLAPDDFVWADANGGYDDTAAREVAPKLADIGFAALEQPLPANRLTGYRRLKQQGALPIVMDEGIVSRTDLEEFLQLGLLDGVAMKVARCGGLTEAVRILKLIEDAGLLWLGSGLTDHDVSLAATLLLYGAFDLGSPAALNGPQFLNTSILRQPFVVEDGSLRVPTGPGLGVNVDQVLIAPRL
jgi:L-alanine-DL-glutamate epimerase-like enolase superfamily enzyme